nr:hypothetical protein [Crenothrix polyspora]
MNGYEKNDLYRSGITHSDYVQMDDISARVKFWQPKLTALY